MKATLENYQRLERALSLALKRHDGREVPQDCVDEVQSSSRFKDIASAWCYYSEYGDTWDDVITKQKEGLIEIGQAENVVSWDRENRAVVRTTRAMEQRKMQRSAQIKRSKICDILWSTCRTVEAFQRALDTVKRHRHKTSNVETRTKAALEQTIAALFRPWEETLPYCYLGKPIYSGQDFAKEENKVANRRVVRINYRGVSFILVRMRRCQNSVRYTHWGMEDSAPWVMLFGSESCWLSGPSLYPTIKNLIQTMTTP